jgi:hypothetical protein
VALTAASIVAASGPRRSERASPAERDSGRSDEGRTGVHARLCTAHASSLSIAGGLARLNGVVFGDSSTAWTGRGRHSAMAGIGGGGEIMSAAFTRIDAGGVPDGLRGALTTPSALRTRSRSFFVPSFSLRRRVINNCAPTQHCCSFVIFDVCGHEIINFRPAAPRIFLARSRADRVRTHRARAA